MKTWILKNIYGLPESKKLCDLPETLRGSSVPCLGPAHSKGIIYVTKRSISRILFEC